MNIGEQAPDFLGLDENGEEIRLSQYKGKKVILYFYPKDSTPGCTAEACSFRDHYTELTEAGYEIIGVSIDSAKSHQNFKQKQQLPFKLISDSDKTLVEQFGVWGEKKMCGRTYFGTFRTTFIIDENGIITNIFLPKQIKTKIHAEQVLNL